MLWCLSLFKTKEASFSYDYSCFFCSFWLDSLWSWGPFATCIVEGYKYFLIIVDDFSRCTWAYLLKLKLDTQFLIPNFVNMVKTQFNRTIKTIRSDNGTKFYLKDFFHSNGILQQLSYVDTPQQNAIVERKHQHILNVARALKFQSKVPL